MNNKEVHVYFFAVKNVIIMDIHHHAELILLNCVSNPSYVCSLIRANNWSNAIFYFSPLMNCGMK